MWLKSSFTFGYDSVANLICQRGNTKESGKLLPYNSVNKTSVLFHRSHQPCSLIISCWPNTSINASQKTVIAALLFLS